MDAANQVVRLQVPHKGHHQNPLRVVLPLPMVPLQNAVVSRLQELKKVRQPANVKVAPLQKAKAVAAAAVHAASHADVKGKAIPAKRYGFTVTKAVEIKKADIDISAFAVLNGFNHLEHVSFPIIHLSFPWHNELPSW